VHHLHFGEIGVHEIAQQDLAVQSPLRVRQLDMCHAVDCALLEYAKTSPVVVYVRLERPLRRLRRQATIGNSLLLGRLLEFVLLVTTKDGREDRVLLFLVVGFVRLAFAFLFAFLFQLDASAVEHDRFPSFWFNTINRGL